MLVFAALRRGCEGSGYEMEGRPPLTPNWIHGTSPIKLKHNSAVVFHTIIDLTGRFPDMVVAPVFVSLSHAALALCAAVAFVALWRMVLAFCTFVFPPEWSTWPRNVSSQ